MQRYGETDWKKNQPMLNNFRDRTKNGVFYQMKDFIDLKFLIDFDFVYWKHLTVFSDNDLS